MPITDDIRASLFNTLSKALKKYSPPMACTSDDKKQTIELIGNKAVSYGHDKKIIPGMYFASVAQLKDSVAFYFFPIYFQTEQFKKAAPGLIKCLKGKTCFHFKKEEDLNAKELDELLKLGVKAWKAEGYLQE